MTIEQLKKTIKIVSYKEVMQVYGLTKMQAVNHLATIRASLSKKRHALLHVKEFCKAENITEDFFYTELCEAYSPRRA